MNKIKSLLLIICIIISIIINIVVVSEEPVQQTILDKNSMIFVTNVGQYKTYGFAGDYPVYTTESLTSFDMPFIIKKTEMNTLSKAELSGKQQSITGSFQERQPQYKYEILAENKDYFLINYHMDIKASTDGFSMDFIPIIKGVEYKDYAWWNSSWNKYAQYTINHDYIEETLTNYPVLIKINDTVGDECNNGNSIRFILSDNTTVLPYEIESWVDNEDRYVWVNVSSVSSVADTVILMYYYNNVAVCTETPNDVWDSNYVMVQHMVGDGVDELEESTVNNYEFSKQMGNVTYNQTGVAGKTVFFDGVDDKIVINTTGLFPTSSDWTLEFWAYSFDALEADGVPFGYYAGTDLTFKIKLRSSTTTKVAKFYSGGTGYITGEHDYVDTWTYYTMRHDDSENTFKQGYNKMFDGNGSSATDMSQDTNTTVGGENDGTAQDYHGYVDEVRVSKTMRTRAWLNATYDNLVNYASFINNDTTATYGFVFIDTASNVEETNATLSGHIVGLNGYTCGFYYNTTEPSEANPGNNVTCVGTYNSDETFTYDITGLTVGEYYYVKSWCKKDGEPFLTSADTTYFLTKPNIPLNISSGKITGINLTVEWNNCSVGQGTNRTTVVRYLTTGYPTSITSGTQLYNGTGNQTVLTDWDANTEYYFSLWHYINCSGSPFLSQISDTYNTTNITTPTKPSDLTVTDYNDTRIVLTWVKGDDNTVIVRNTTDPVSATDGTEIYNGSAETCADTGLTPSITYYYRAYNWNGTHHSIGNSSVNQSTKPQPPQDVSSDVTVMSGSSMDVNISWINGTGSNVTLIRRSSSSQPLVITDGTQVYNSSLPYHIESGITTVYYYTLWSYCNDTGLYSTPVNLTDLYVVMIFCYNESNPSANVSLYNVFFTNPDGTQTYSKDECTNPHIVNVSDIPQGDNIALFVNATGYKGRIYYLDIELTGIYAINCYLPPVESENVITRLYTIKVIDDFNNPLSNVKVTISRYRNETEEYVNISSDYTDGYGEVSFQFIPESFLRVVLEKTGYNQTGSKYWQPDPVFYGANYPKIFQMEIVISEIETLWYGINYSIEPRIYDHYTNITFYFNITSSTGEIEWFSASFYYYNVTAETWTLLYNETNSVDSGGGSISYITSNTSGKYAIEASFKKTGYDAFNFGTPHSSDKYVFTLWDIISGLGDAGEKFDDAITDIIGNSPVYVGNIYVAYSSLIVCFIVMMVLFTFSPKYAGLSIIVLGIILGAFKQPLNLINDDVMNYSVVALIIILGVLTIYVTRKKEG